jgi:predicted RNA-binding Zn-ribbon protein involved in translation (DUF1610 family)
VITMKVTLTWLRIRGAKRNRDRKRRSAKCPVCEVSMIGRSMKPRKLSS